MSHVVLDKKQRIAQQFGRAAKRYDDMAKVQLDIAIDAMQCLPTDMDQVLDIGCGTGRVTRLLAKRSQSVLGVDLAPGMIELATETHVDTKNMSFAVGDAENLPFDSLHFDVVFSSMALQWCDPITPSFSEIYRVLKPGGKAILAMLSAGSMAELDHAWRQVGEQGRVNQFMSHQDLVDQAQKVGFSTTHKLIPYVTNHPNLTSLLNSVRHVGASVLPNKHQHQPLTRAALGLLEGAYWYNFERESLLPLTYQVSFLSVSKPL